MTTELDLAENKLQYCCSADGRWVHPSYLTGDN